MARSRAWPGRKSANNAAAGGAFIPLMTLGIPPNVVMALLLGAFIIHGLQPGPLLITQNPGLFWGIVASMYIGNVMLLVLNLPMIGMWVQVLKLPYNILFPLIIMFTIIGVYCSSNNVFDVYVMIAFGVIGYFMRKFGYEPAPLVLAFVLGPMLENNLRKSLILSQGDLHDLRRAADLGRVPGAGGGAAGRAAAALAAQEARTGRAGRGSADLRLELALMIFSAPGLPAAPSPAPGSALPSSASRPIRPRAGGSGRWTRRR